MIKKWLADFIKNNSNILTMRYSYYKNTYNDKWLCKLIVYEYFHDLINYDIKYIDNNEYLNDIFDDYNN